MAKVNAAQAVIDVANEVIVISSETDICEEVIVRN